MRPERITIEGFAAFRERAEVDLTDTDLFALVGPTGAGKSSVIDAMVFALYGSVPRYGSENLVHPVITQGALEARVRLDFRVGELAYTATRVVRRTKTGASTKEARLERAPGPDHDGPGDVLADDAKSMTTAVVDLLGLDLEQFTKCVVLPQGAFATLLHDTKATRQDLLVKLLGLGLYERLAAAARGEAKQASFRIESLDEQLARSAHATPEAIAEAAARVEGLDAVVGVIDDARPRLDALDERLRASAEEIEHAARAAAALRSVTAPEDVASITRDAAAAVEGVRSAEEAEDAAATAVSAAEHARHELADPTELRRTRDDHHRAGELDARIDKGRALLAESEAERSRLATELETAETRRTQAVDARDRARVGHAAADLARHLHVGDDCPVCGNRVAALPELDQRVLADADEALRSADAELAAATARVAEVDKQLASYRATLEERVVERDTVAERLRDAPTVAEIESSLARIVEADTELEQARRRDAEARRATASARARADEARQHLDRARAGYHAARDRVAAYEPPPAGADLDADWKELEQWAGAKATEFDAAVTTAERERTSVADDRASLVDDLRTRAVAVGLDGADPAAWRDHAVRATARAQAEHAQLEREAAAASTLRDERSAADERRQVHELLADQLGARGFEAWLLDEALDALLDGATSWLEQLSSGRYAMAVDDKKQFVVIDHANADERRLARTLSGGETFLASLALALALAERVGELSATSAAHLDAIFLDEGFGTLDPDTLDVVATAIEELGATGRMVGVISHVPALAERVLVRFEIAKAPGTSTVRRVEA